MTFDPVTAQNGNWRVTLLWKGEGYHGQMSQDPEDEDRPCLRLVVHGREGSRWPQVHTGLTYLLATDPRDDLEDAASILLKRLGRHDRAPEPFIFSKLCYVHMGPDGPRIDVPLDSRDGD